MKNANCWFPGVTTWLFVLCICTKEFNAILAVEEETVIVNTAKWAQVVSDRFLSITIDPETILFGKDTVSSITRLISLAHGLTPSFIRIGGPDAHQYRFEGILSEDDVLDNKTITESQWVMFNDFAREAGLDIIVCLSALQRLNGIWDPRNALDLISFSDKMGYKIDWELGYELLKLNGQVSAEQIAMDVNRLRNILNSFSLYKHSIILGPDITQLYTKKDVDFLKVFIQETGSSLDAITWHPKYLSSSHLTSGEDLDYMLNRLIFEKEGLTKMLGRQIARKPIWIAESEKHTSQGYFLDALSWAQKLGTFAGIGIQTVMKQPNLQELLEIPPTYWVSLLHKALAGQIVLDVRHKFANNTNTPVFCHCTNTIKSSKAAELVTTHKKYELGAITFFAVNRRNYKVNLSVKLSSGMKQEDIELHQYLLTADQAEVDPLLSRKVLLNGKLLNLEHTGSLPELSPNIKHIGWNLTVNLPPASIGFWVIPRANVKFCITALKKTNPHKVDAQPKLLVKTVNSAMSVGSYINSLSTINSELFSRDLKYSDNLGISNKETNEEYHEDKSNIGAFKKKKHHNLRHKTFLEKKVQESKGFITEDEHETRPLHILKHENDVIDKASGQLSKSSLKDHKLKVQGNYTGNTSIEQRPPIGRYKRHAPENNNAMSFTGVPIELFQQPTLSGRAAKTRRKKKTDLKSDKIEDREQRKDNKLKHRDDNIQATLFDPFLSSIENEEQYFRHMKREDNEIKAFPSGDIYLKQGDSSEEQRNSDYDYVDRDDKDIKENEDEVDDIGTTDIDLSLKPGEFFETIHGTTDKINERFVGYGGELWEAETITMATPTEKMEDVIDDNDDAYDHEVVHESGPTEEEDRKRKAAAAKLLNSYLTEGYAEQSEENKHKDKASKKTRIQRKTERKQEYAQDYDDNINYFLTDHKEKTKKFSEKPIHHHHHHHHITGHSKPVKEGKHNHYDHAHNIHNHKDKTRKITHHNQKHIFSEEDDIFFPHIANDKERDHKRNHANHRSLHFSEERIELLNNFHKGREKVAKNNKIKNDLNLSNEHFEDSSTITKSSPRRSRARKVSHKLEEEDNTHTKPKNYFKTPENDNDDNLSRVHQESFEDKKVTHQNDKQQKKKNNKPSTASSNDHVYQEIDIQEEKMKSKDKQKHSDNTHGNKYETKNKNSEALDSRSIENDTKMPKKKVLIMDTNDSFEDESKINSEITEDESEQQELDVESVEESGEKTFINLTKPNRKIVVRSSSEIFEDVKLKSTKHKEKNTNHKSGNIKIDSSSVSTKNNEKGEHRKSKRIDNSSKDITTGDMLKKSESLRKSSQVNDVSSEEVIEKAPPASRSSMKTQNSKGKSESANKNKHRSQENSLEPENNNNHSIEENSLEFSSKLDTKSDDAHENLSVASSRSELEPNYEPLSDEDISNEDVLSQHSHKQKGLNASKSKYKTIEKHRSKENTLEDNTSSIQSEPKKRHTSSEHYAEPNEGTELRSEVSKLEGEGKHSGEIESIREKSRIPSDENNEKPSKEKEKKRKNGKHKVTRKNDHHNRTRRGTSSVLLEDKNNNSFNYNYSSEGLINEMPLNNGYESLAGINLEFRDNDMDYLIDNANKFMGDLIAEDNAVNLEPNMLLAPQQYKENGDVLEHSSGHEDIVLEDLSQERIQHDKTAKYKFEDETFKDLENERQIETWTFRNDDSLGILKDRVIEPLVRENNAKREVYINTFENALTQSNSNKEKDSKDKMMYNNSPNQENMNSNHVKENSRKENEKNIIHIQFQNPIDAVKILNTTNLNEATPVQDNFSLENSRNKQELSNEESRFYLPESPVNINQNIPVETSGEGQATRNALILENKEFENFSEKNINKELSKEELIHSKEKSNEIKLFSSEIILGINQYAEKEKLKNISMKSLEASEYVDHSPINFITADKANSLNSAAEQNLKPLVEMFSAEAERKVALNYDKTYDGHDSNEDTEDNKFIELKYHTNVSENIQLERVPKAIIYISENASNADKMEAISFEGKHVLNQVEETRIVDNGSEKLSTIENTENYIFESSSKELNRNIELLDGISTISYDQEHSARDSNIEEPASLSSLSPATKLSDDDGPTKVSLVSANEDARNSSPSNVSNERSSSGSDGKRIKGLKTFSLPKKNLDRLTLENKHKERLQQFRERRAKIKAVLFKKPDAFPIKKADSVNTNKQTRKRRTIKEDSVDHESSLQHLINDENLSEQMNADTFDSSSDGQKLTESSPLWATKDDGTFECMEEQLSNIKLIQKAQHTTPYLWNTDTFITPSHLAFESSGVPEHHTPKSAEHRSKEFSDTISVPVTLHKTLMVTENNHYSNEEAITDETEQIATNNKFSSEEVFAKLRTPLINYEPLNNVQQGVTHFHKLLPIHENDIDILMGYYSNNYESGDTEVKEELDMNRFQRYVSSVLEGDTHLKNNFQSLPLAAFYDVNKFSDDKAIIFKVPLYGNGKHTVNTLPAEVNIASDALATSECNNNWLIEDTPSENKATRKEAMFASGTNDADSGLLFPTFEVIADMEAMENEDEDFINEETRSEEQEKLTARFKRALKMGYDPLNDDLLLPFTIPIMPENEKILDAFLNKIDAQQSEEISNKIDSLEVIKPESNIKKVITNDNINQADHTAQSILRKPVNLINANDKILQSNVLNQISTNNENINEAKVDATLLKSNFLNTVHPNSLDFHILNFGRKESGYNSKGNELNAVISHQADNKAEGRTFYENIDLEINEHLNPKNSKERIKYLYPSLKNYSPIRKIIEEYTYINNLTPSSSGIINNKTVENNNSSESDEENAKEILSTDTNLLNDSPQKHYANPNEELSILFKLHAENETNNFLNQTNAPTENDISSEDYEENLNKIVNMKTNLFNGSSAIYLAKPNEEDSTNGTLLPNKEDVVTMERNSPAQTKPVRASKKGKHEHEKASTNSQPRTIRSILKILTESVIGFLHQLSPWKTTGN